MTEKDAEPADHRLRRLYMRSIRRGIKEMDIILGGYADAGLARLPEDWLPVYDALLSENDHDLYQWVTGQMPPPPAYAALIDDIARHSGASPRDRAATP